MPAVIDFSGAGRLVIIIENEPHTIGCRLLCLQVQQVPKYLHTTCTATLPAVLFERLLHTGAPAHGRRHLLVSCHEPRQQL